MLAAIILFASTFAIEAGSSIGKESARRHRENVYDMGFLSLFWGLVFLLVTLLFGAPWRFQLASLPTLLPRLGLEIALTYINAEAIIRADRTTTNFLRLISIPLLLVVDLALGYHISAWQLAGVGIMFVALIVAFSHNRHGRRGAWLAVLSGLLAVGTVSLYKYDITHFNSIAAEQTLVLAVLVAYFYVGSARLRRQSPLRLLLRPVTGTQSLASGVAVVLESFAFGLAPASVILTFKRSFGLMWAVIFGGTYFHEHSLRRKVSSGALMVTSLLLMAGLPI